MRKEKVRREKEKNITKLYMIKKSKIEWKITMKWNKKKNCYWKEQKWKWKYTD